MEIIIVIAVIAGVLVLNFMNQARLMAKPELLLRHDETVVSQIECVVKPDEQIWLRDNGYQYFASYRFQQIMFSVWRKQDGATDVVIYVRPDGKLTYDMVSYFESDQMLTTAINGETGMCPLPPGTYKESVDCRSLVELAQAHQKSISILRQMRCVLIRQTAPDFETHLIDSIRHENAYMKGFFLWQIRSLYWYFVKRHILRGKSIEIQLQKDRI